MIFAVLERRLIQLLIKWLQFFINNIAKYKPLNNRERRLISYISQFRLKIRYIPGRNNKLADMLSRIPEDLNSSQI